MKTSSLKTITGCFQSLLINENMSYIYVISSVKYILLLWLWLVLIYYIVVIYTTNYVTGVPYKCKLNKKWKNHSTQDSHVVPHHGTN